jgi:hypothetical protein
VRQGSVNFTIGRPFLGRDLAYIYVLCSKHFHVLYVGQTNVFGGVCTRLGGHLDRDGTFRKCLMRYKELDVEEVDDLQVFAFGLPSLARYVSLDAGYREGVEYGLQKRLHSVSGTWKPYFRLVSNVYAPATTDFPEVVQLAEHIFVELQRLYHHS